MSYTQELNNLLTKLSYQYFLYKHFHWNFEGDLFYQYHQLFDSSASQVYSSLDAIAERVRQLKEVVSFIPNQLSEEGREGLPTSQEELKQILEILIASHQEVSTSMKNIIQQADANNDPSTSDLVTSFLEDQEKMEWFLRSSLAK